MTTLLDYTAFQSQDPGWPSFTTSGKHGGALSSVGFGVAIMFLPADVTSYGAGVNERYNGDLAQDGTAEVDVKFPAGTYEAPAVFHVRDSGSLNLNCYSIFANPSNDLWEVRRRDGTPQPNGWGTLTTLGSFTKTGTGGKNWRIKVFMQGATLRVRVWEKALAEPGTWNYDATTTGYVPTGTGLRCQYGSGLAAVPTGGLQLQWDNFLFNDIPASGVAHVRNIARTLTTHTG